MSIHGKNEWNNAEKGQEEEKKLCTNLGRQKQPEKKKIVVTCFHRHSKRLCDVFIFMSIILCCFSE